MSEFVLKLGAAVDILLEKSKIKYMDKKIYFFPVTIEPLKEGGFFAGCPVLQGCHAEGKTYGEAIENIQDIIRIHVLERRKHGDILPEVSVPRKTEVRLSLPLPICV